MPVNGPNLDWASNKGREVGEALLAKLIEEHNLLDITEPKYDKMLNLPNAKERWIAAKEAFVKTVEELFLEDAANSW